ncbi:hypothetical protein [Rhizobium alvei]|uniref:Uncharacterized protein n=1 Tax=Rhizobium alvei TaxID=1132659 RepID=A0ABT8YUU2_9HYPH|nr:hypothetical protein [Rhizobium alvei]MDO6967013.1 hypothetical protein [Rhizobium alvei]
MRKADDPTLYISTALQLIPPATKRAYASKIMADQQAAKDEIAKAILAALENQFELTYKADRQHYGPSPAFQTSAPGFEPKID